MAAMAPALTDAPAEARHIRFKLASPSSTLSPDSTENNSNASNILISDSVSDSAGSHTNGKCHISADDGQSFALYHSVKGLEQEPLSNAPSLGKLAPYLCSDAKPLPSSTKVKESLKLQSVLIKQSVLKSHGLLSGSIFPSAAAGGDFLLRKRHTLELTAGQLKSLVNGGSTMVPVNGLSKKVAVPSAAVAEKGSVATVNGDSNQPSTNEEALLSVSSNSVGTFANSGQNGDMKPQQNLTPSVQGLSSHKEPTALFESTEVKAEPESPVVETNSNNIVECPLSLNSSPVNDDLSLSTPNMEALLQDRAQQSQHRQVDIEGRLLRLRKRLQVVQAKQVQRHFKQQLSGFLDHTLTPTSSCRADQGAWRGTRASMDTHAHNLSRFLKGGRVASELEQLHLSGTTYLRATEAQFDSDATESSSGGESDIEEEELARADLEQRHIKLWRRAEGRFARERATIISHWTWLQAQISDLEYRIRQQVDISRQLRSSKGPVELGDSAHSCQKTVNMTETKENVPTSKTFQNFTESQSRLADTSEIDISISSVAEVSDTCSSSPDSSCTSARTRPLLTCRRRRLIHPNTVHNLNGKFQRVSFSPPCVCEVNGSCVMCGGAPPLSKPDLPFNRPLLERVAHQDRSIHPVLSMQSDVALSLQLKKVLRSHWQTRPFDRIKPLKKTSLKNKLSITPSSSSLSKHKFRLSHSHAAAVRLARHKSRSQRLHRLQVDNISCVPKLDTLTPCRPDRVLVRSHSRKRVREHSLDRADSPKVVMDACPSPCASLSSLHSSNTSPLTRQLSLPVESSTPLGNSMPIRRRRGESPFDINNIVIPMSAAATTRVEKLQYKEILTPRWREVDVLAKPLAEEDNNIPVEDLSDGAFTKLHQLLEDQERSRWRWTALAPAKRRGSRSYKSLDGRTTPSIVGTNPSTPQPSSPDTSHFHFLQDYGPVPSPLSPPSPDTPCSRDAHTPHTRLLYSEDTCGSTSDCTFEETTVQPWEPRSFPLPEDPIVEPETDKSQPSFSTCPRADAHCRAESESDTSSP
ncbi:KAT8 regulatory NSL complex subunit 1 [Carassius gibelio]|uniref:KAT8 regulatory NSL complex subunit 1 n=1 Tax=Carassius gibelio TaxID=101364 RepID=UPI002279D159|nr:KAT8 regulatory NSL complex subunit 1 [Carassius gibelio]